MKVTLYRYEKETLVMRSVEMEKLQAALRTENLNKPVSTTRDKAMFALPGTQNSYIQKLPVVVFGGTFRKTGEPAPPMRDYSGLVLLEVNHLSDLQEAVQIRQQAAMMPHELRSAAGIQPRCRRHPDRATDADGGFGRDPYRPGRTIRTTSKANARYVTQLSDRYTVQHSDGRRHPKIRTNKRRGSQAGLYPISR